MDQAPAACSKLGRAIVGLGLLGLIRIIPEALRILSFANATYGQILAADVILSALVLAAGGGLMAGKRWGPASAALAAGALLVNSGAFLVFLLPEFLRDFRFDGSNLIVNVFPRLLFYGISLGFWPFAQRLLLKEPQQNPASRAVLWSCFLGGAALSGAYAAFVLFLQ